MNMAQLKGELQKQPQVEKPVYSTCDDIQEHAQHIVVQYSQDANSKAQLSAGGAHLKWK